VDHAGGTLLAGVDLQVRAHTSSWSAVLQGGNAAQKTLQIS